MSRIVVLNGSPRLNGNVVNELKKTVSFFLKKYGWKEADVKWIDASALDFSSCKGCMVCRSKKRCVKGRRRQL